MKPANTSLAEKAYSVIREKILRGDLPLGQILSRRKLADELEMSFSPVTEAFQRLEADGLVESRPRVGTRVRIPTTLDVRGHYVVREALETQSARLFAQKASPEEREELLEMASLLDDLYAESHVQDRDKLYVVHKKHARLHMRIAECSGYPALVSAIEKNQVLVLNWLYETAAHRSPPARWHLTLARLLVSGDATKAEEAMRRHVRYGMEELVQQLEQGLGKNGWLPESEIAFAK